MVVLLFLLLLSVIIVIHELGHLIAAKIFGVYCHEFSMGMGPKVLSYKGKETTYSLRLIPIGGFVSMAGDTDNDLESKVDIEVPKERTLLGIAAWKKIIIMLAGIFMNVLLALVISSLVFLSTGFYAASADTTIASVDENLNAYKVGLRAGDKITKLSYEDLNISYKPKTFEDMTYFMYGNEEHPLTIEVLRNGQKLSFTIDELTFDNETQRYVMGISANPYNIVEVNIFNCWWAGFDYLYQMTRTIFMSLGQLVKGVGFENLSGPVGIFDATSQAVSAGFTTYILMIAMLSLNVGIFNALPLPILDGGRVVITIIEKIIGRPLSEKAINILMTMSMALLLMLVVFATMQDIRRLF